MKKRGLLLTGFFMMAMLLGGCGGKTTEQAQTASVESVTIRLGGLKGPTSMGMVKLLEDAANQQTVNTYEFTMAAAADELTAPLLRGELDILSVPVNLGAILYNQTQGAVRMFAINTLGVISIVEKGEALLTDWEGLRGKTLYATGKGSTPEYTLSYLLAQHGMKIGEDVLIEWKSEPNEVVTLMANQEYALAMMPQPFVTVAATQLENLHIALDLTEEWNRLENGSQFLTAGLIVRNEFAQQHPEALASFLEEYTASVDYVNANPAEAASLIEKYGILKAAIAEKAIPHCNLVSISGEEMKALTNTYLDILLAQNPGIVGKALPDDAFYWVNE